MTKATLSQLADMVGGTIIGNGEMEIFDVAPLHAANPGTITFLLTGTKRVKPEELEKSKASAAVVGRDFTTEHCSLIQVDDILPAFETIVRYFRPVMPEPEPSISDRAEVASDVVCGEGVRIDAGAVIGPRVTLGDHVVIHAGAVVMHDSTIGSDTVLFPNVVLYENTVVGNNCLIHANAVLGAYGFGYDSSTGRHILSAQLGNVVLEDDVEIGASTTIDRGTYGSTLIGKGTKIDNLVMIAHNCRIGCHNLICAHTGVAGSTTTGDYVVMAGRVGIRDHVHIGTGAVLGAMAGVMGDIPEGTQYVGIPATPEKEQMKKQVALAKLPEMRKEFREVQATVAKIVKKLEQENGSDT